MEVWAEQLEESPPPRRIRRRQFHDVKEMALWFAQVVGAVTVVLGFGGLLLSSLGFKISGSAESISAIQNHAALQDTAIAHLQHQFDEFDSRTKDIAYLACESAKKNQPGIILPRSCK